MKEPYYRTHEPPHCPTCDCGAEPTEAEALRKDAERYRKLRRMCCSADGPTRAITDAWMIGDEQAADVALDAAGS